MFLNKHFLIENAHITKSYYSETLHVFLCEANILTDFQIYISVALK